MNASRKPNEYHDSKTYCTETSRLSHLDKLDKGKDQLNFFKDPLEVEDRMERLSEEWNFSLCPAAIGLENKYKCCSTSTADTEGELAQIEEENVTLKGKLNAMLLISEYKHFELLRLSKRVEIEKSETSKAETKLRNLVAHVNSANKMIAEILTDLQSGESQNLQMPQSSKEMDGQDPEVTENTSEEEMVHALAEMSIHVNNQFQKWYGMQMKRRPEVRTLCESVERMEKELLKSESLNAEELPQVGVITPEKCSILQELLSGNGSKESITKPVLMSSLLVERLGEKNKRASEKVPIIQKIFTEKNSEAEVIKPVPIPSMLIQRFVDGKIEVSRYESNEQNTQGKNLNPNPSDGQIVDKSCSNGPDHVDNNHCTNHNTHYQVQADQHIDTSTRKGISGNKSKKQQKQIEDEGTKMSLNADGYSHQKCSSIDGICSNQINQQEEHLQRKSVVTMALPQVGKIPSDRKTFTANTSKAASLMKSLPIPSILPICDGKIEISTNENNEENSPDKNLHSNPTDGQFVDKPRINGHSHIVDRNGHISHDRECNKDESSSKEVQQQSALPDPPQNKHLQDITTVKKTHYQMKAEEGTDKDRFYCKCGKSFLQKSLLNAHTRRENESRIESQCNYCDKRFMTRRHLKRHIEGVHKTNRFPCQFCKITLSSKPCLKRHMAICESNPSRDPRIVFHCSICDKGLASKRNLNLHIRTHKGTRFACHLCEKTLVSKTSLQIHLKMHTGQRDHKCDICDKSFVAKSHLRNHKITHSNAMEKKHICHLCDGKFLQKCSLKKHMRSHTEEKPYKCNSCQKCFKTAWNLKFHEAKHSGEKHHKCPVCSASFRRKIYLKVHQRTHTTNKRLYSCSKCSRTYRNSDGLKYHFMAHHSPVCLPAFHCIFCDKALQTKGGLYQHIRTHIGESRIFCEYCDKGFRDVGYKDYHVSQMHSSGDAT